MNLTYESMQFLPILIKAHAYASIQEYTVQP